MTIESYIECYKFCLKQGWVHNTPEIDVAKEYFDSIKGRKILFERHLNKIRETDKLEDIHILIGEAPPYYPNINYPKTENRKYFYDIEHSIDTGYFKEPCNHFLKISDWKKVKRSKDKLLDDLAKKGVLIFDIFPFPIFQSTDIRGKVVWGTNIEDENTVSEFYSSRKSKFNEYLDSYFSPRFNDLLESIEKKRIFIYMFAPKLASVQFLYWFKCTEWKNNLVDFKCDFTMQEEVENKKTGEIKIFLNDSLKNFVSKLADNDKKKKKDFIENILKKYPIFMNGSGNPDFNNFVNGIKSINNLK